MTRWSELAGGGDVMTRNVVTINRGRCRRKHVTSYVTTYGSLDSGVHVWFRGAVNVTVAVAKPESVRWLMAFGQIAVNKMALKLS